MGKFVFLTLLILTATATASAQTARDDATLDARRIGFAPTSVQRINYAPQHPNQWTTLPRTASFDGSVAAPDGSTAGARLYSVTGEAAYLRLVSLARDFKVGDWVLAGVWAKRPTDNSANFQNYAVARLTIGDISQAFELDHGNGGTGNYRTLRTSQRANEQWEWLTLATKITRLGAIGGTGEIRFELLCDAEHAVNFYAPVLHQIGAGALSDAEVLNLLRNLFSVPDGAPQGAVALARGQQFVLPDLGDGASTRFLTVTPQGLVGAGPGAGGGMIGGTINLGEVGYGGGTNTLTSSDDFTYQTGSIADLTIGKSTRDGRLILQSDNNFVLRQMAATTPTASYTVRWPAAAAPDTTYVLGVSQTTPTQTLLDWVPTNTGVSGSGTLNKLARWNGATTLADSIVSESGANLTVAGGLTANQSTNGLLAVLAQNLNSGNAAGAAVAAIANTITAQIIATSPTFASSGLWAANYGILSAGGPTLLLEANDGTGNEKIVFGLTEIERARLTATGFRVPTASYYNWGATAGSSGYGLREDAGQIQFKHAGGAWAALGGGGSIGGTIATGQVAFGSAANTIAGNNALWWDSAGGRLGIGTTTPALGLHLYGTSTSDQCFVVGVSSAPSTDGINVCHGGAFLGAGGSFINAHSTTAANGQFRFLVNAQTVLTLNNAMNMGVGTTSPAGKLHVQGSITTEPTLIVQAASGQTADLVRAQTSAGANLLRLGPSGSLTIAAQNNASTPLFVSVPSDGILSDLISASLGTTQFFRVNAVGSLTLGAANSLTGTIYLLHSGSATATSLSAGPAASTLNYILPVTAPTGGQVVQAAAPSGSNVQLSWAAIVGGSGTANQIPKFLNANTLTDSVITEVNGNLGVGTTTPGGLFDLQGNSASDVLHRFWNTGAGGAKLRYVASNTATAQVQFTGLSRWWSALAATQDFLQFRTLASDDPINTEAQLAASPRMTILQNGNVGIGTTSPITKLTVAGGVLSNLSTNGGTGITAQNLNSGNAALAVLNMIANTVNTALLATSSTFASSGLWAANYGILSAGGPTLLLEANDGTGNEKIVFGLTEIERARLTATGFRVPTASYYNWGATAGSSGYGLREDAGQIQFKHAGGAWAALGGGGSIGGTIATGQVAFGSAANTIAGNNALWWDSAGGRLGIGTTTPALGLHLYGTSTSDQCFVVGVSSAPSTDGINVCHGGAFLGAGGSFINAHSTTAANGQFRFLVNAQTVLTLNNAMNMGVGTTSPAGKLHVQGSITTEPTLIVQAASGQTAQLLLARNSAGSSLFEVDKAGHLLTKAVSGTNVPSISGIAGASCSLNSGSTDTAGRFEVSGGNGCTLTFGTAYGAIPACVASSEQGTSIPFYATANASTFSVSAGTTHAATYYYVCLGK